MKQCLPAVLILCVAVTANAQPVANRLGVGFSDPDIGLTLGRGYDFRDPDDALPSPIDLPSLNVPGEHLTESGSQSYEERFDSTKRIETNLQFVNVQARAASVFTGGRFSVQASYSAARGETNNSQAVTWTINLWRVIGTQSLPRAIVTGNDPPNPPPSDAAAAAMFIDSYGTHYVEQVTKAALVQLRLRLYFNTNEKSEDRHARLQASVNWIGGSGGIDGSVQNRVESLLQEASVYVIV